MASTVARASTKFSPTNPIYKSTSYRARFGSSSNQILSFEVIGCSAIVLACSISPYTACIMGLFTPKETSATTDVELATTKSTSTTAHRANQWPSISREGITTEPPPPYSASAELQSDRTLTRRQRCLSWPRRNKGWTSCIVLSIVLIPAFGLTGYLLWRNNCEHDSDCCVENCG